MKTILKKNPVIWCLLKRVQAYLVGFISTKIYVAKRWKKKFLVELNIDKPETFNEKLQYLKVYGKQTKLHVQCADKLAVRDYVAQNIGKIYLNRLIAQFDSIAAFKNYNLPSKCVVKTNHDSGTVVLIKGDADNKPDFNALMCAFKINYGKLSKEWVYSDIKPKVLVEELLEAEDGKDLKDYKVFCFHGVPKLIQVDLDRFEDHKRNFYDLDWNLLDLEIEYPSVDVNVSKPALLEEMIKLSAKLAAPFNHVRVDWYVVNNKLIFGEMTFFHESGFGRFNNKVWEIKMGEWIRLDI